MRGDNNLDDSLRGNFHQFLDLKLTIDKASNETR